jgi:hypothetical protein
MRPSSRVRAGPSRRQGSPEGRTGQIGNRAQLRHEITYWHRDTLTSRPTATRGSADRAGNEEYQTNRSSDTLVIISAYQIRQL